MENLFKLLIWILNCFNKYLLKFRTIIFNYQRQSDQEAKDIQFKVHAKVFKIENKLIIKNLVNNSVS